MNTGQIIKSRTTERFTVITNDISRSKELTLEEKGLMVFLLSLPGDWVLYKTNLHEHLGEQKGTVDRIWRNLQKKGYIVSVKSISSDGRFNGWNHVVYDLPAPETEELRNQESPTPTNIDVGKSVPILKTNILTKKEGDTKKEEDVIDVIEYLNLKAKKNFSPKSKSNVSFISARLKDYSVDDLKEIIDMKCKQWLTDPKMNPYLRPETLFNQSKCESYFNELSAPKQQENTNSQGHRQVPPVTVYPGNFYKKDDQSQNNNPLDNIANEFGKA